MNGAQARAGTTEDLGAVVDVERDADRRFADVGLDELAEAEPVASTQLAEAIADGRLVVADDDGRVVAFAWWSTVDGQAHLEQVSVVVDAAGKRIGRTLIEWVATQARAAGLTSLTLTTFADVAWNGPLYRHYGFDTLVPEDFGPELTARCAHERDIGVDVLPRVAMRRLL